MSHAVILLLAGFGLSCWVLARLREAPPWWVQFGVWVAGPWLAVVLIAALYRAEASLFRGTATIDLFTTILIALGAFALTARNKLKGGANADPA